MECAARGQPPGAAAEPLRRRAVSGRTATLRRATGAPTIGIGALLRYVEPLRAAVRAVVGFPMEPDRAWGDRRSGRKLGLAAAADSAPRSLPDLGRTD